MYTPEQEKASWKLYYHSQIEASSNAFLKNQLLTSQAEIHCQRAEFWRQITAAGVTSTAGCISGSKRSNKTSSAKGAKAKCS
ncbi:hypothetical protein CFP56_039610 [Quercus suber]|uniref:Uncharacterized protein n=1 Tax=Quercus suber TaxID=58331 RepID=A0AAW0MAI3_QUESU